MKHITIIGAGLSGLSAAYDLGRQGHRVTLIESASEIGGLASSRLIDGVPVEHFYHFICGPDSDLINLTRELGIGNRLHWVKSRTNFFYHGHMYGFGTPFDLLFFKPVPFFQRIRFGLNVMASRYRKEWMSLDGLGAKRWLIEQIGQGAYDVIWDPLLRVKFGDYHDTISAAWIWHRINRVAASRRVIWEPEHLGYLEQGSETVIAALAEKLRAMPNVTIRTRVRVERIVSKANQVTGVRLVGEAETLPCDGVISTVALTPLAKITPDLPEEYRKKIEAIEYIGVVCGLLKLRRPISSSFWVNINDPHIPFNGIIEYTNLNQHLRDSLDGKSIAYIPYYLRTDAPRFSYTDEQLQAEFIAGIQRVNPDITEADIEECHIARAPYAQAICTVGFARQVPDHRTPLTGLYITDSTQFYPEDRTISAAIRLGRRAATLLMQDMTL